MGAGASAAASGPQDKSFLETMVEFTKAANDAVENSTAAALVEAWAKKRDELIVKVRGELSKEERGKATTMITLLQEQIYTAKGLPDNWANEVKYEQAEDGYVASVGEHKIQLGGHFPAGQARLVVTPLTRVCRQKIFEAAATGKIVHFHGPAGTGKTETMKDTLQDLGWDVVVVSCSSDTTADQIKDAIGGGKPVVFDDVNRLSEEVMKEFPKLIPQEKPAIGITCNPAFEGRTEMPEAILGQCVSLPMLVPDFELIVEIMLFCEGFVDGSALGAKIVSLAKDCREKLSTKPYYDFGMRKLKQLTRECGVAGRAEAFKDEQKIVASTILQSLNDMCAPGERGLLKELAEKAFGTEISVSNDDPLSRVLKVRHGAMIVSEERPIEECRGEAEKAAKAAGKEVVVMADTMTIDPGAFFGQMNGEEWSEGVFTKALREANDKNAWLFVNCGDGDDAAKATVNWESLHTLTDDNKMLTLSTGEKIPLNAECRIVFISKDCSSMSPASISRLGMVAL